MTREAERHRARVAARYVQAARYTLEVDFRHCVRDLTRNMQRQPAGARQRPGLGRMSEFPDYARCGI